MYRKILIGMLVLIASMNAVAADLDYGVSVSVFAHTSPEHIKENAYDLNFQTTVVGIPKWAYPIEVRYIFDGSVVYNKTIENGSGSFGSVTTVQIEGKPSGIYKHTEVQIISATGTLVGLADTYVPVYMFNENKNIDLQTMKTNITETTKCSILCFSKELVYNARFTIKNMNKTFAFNGEIQFGDLGIASPWKVEKKVILGPGETIEIERSNMTIKDLQDLRTELHY